MNSKNVISFLFMDHCSYTIRCSIWNTLWIQNKCFVMEAINYKWWVYFSSRFYQWHQSLIFLVYPISKAPGSQNVFKVYSIKCKWKRYEWERYEHKKSCRKESSFQISICYFSLHFRSHLRLTNLLWPSSIQWSCYWRFHS